MYSVVEVSKHYAHYAYYISAALLLVLAFIVGRLYELRRLMALATACADYTKKNEATRAELLRILSELNARMRKLKDEQ